MNHSFLSTNTAVTSTRALKGAVNAPRSNGNDAFTRLGQTLRREHNALSRLSEQMRAVSRTLAQN